MPEHFSAAATQRNQRSRGTASDDRCAHPGKTPEDSALGRVGVIVCFAFGEFRAARQAFSRIYQGFGGDCRVRRPALLSGKLPPCGVDLRRNLLQLELAPCLLLLKSRHAHLERRCIFPGAPAQRRDGEQRFRQSAPRPHHVADGTPNT
jgi:hypothetical protein